MKICKLVEESYSALEVDETAMFYLDAYFSRRYRKERASSRIDVCSQP